jgi:hypothetical protein
MNPDDVHGSEMDAPHGFDDEQEPSSFEVED